jgi:O-antigen/teichoic acid export membrane protein
MGWDIILPIMEGQQNKKISVRANYFFNVSYQVASLIVNIITAPYLSRIFDPSTIGTNSYASSICSIFYLFEAFGFGLYAQRSIAQERDDKEKQTRVFWEILGLRGLICLLVLLSYYSCCFFGAFGDLKDLMIAYGIQLVATIFDISFFFQGNERFSVIAWVGVLVKAVGVACVFLFVKTNADLLLYIVIQSLAIAGSFIFMWPFLCKNIVRIKFKSMNLKRHFLPCLRLFIPAIALNISPLIDRTLIANLVFGQSQRVVDGVETTITNASLENGYYEEAYKIEIACLTVITSLGNVMAPHNAHFAAIGDMDAIQKNLQKSVHFVWLLGLPIVLGVISIATTFVPFFFGTGYEKSIYLLMLMSPLIIFSGLSNVMGNQLLIPLNKDGAYTKAIIWGCAINIVTSAALVYFWGSFGAATGTIIGEFTILLLLFLSSRKFIQTKPLFKEFWKPAVAACLMFAVILPLDLFVFTDSVYWQILILIFAGIIIYSSAILLFKDSYVIAELHQIKEKIRAKHVSK